MRCMRRRSSHGPTCSPARWGAHRSRTTIRSPSRSPKPTNADSSCTPGSTRIVPSIRPRRRFRRATSAARIPDSSATTGRTCGWIRVTRPCARSRSAWCSISCAGTTSTVYTWTTTSIRIRRRGAGRRFPSRTTRPGGGIERPAGHSRAMTGAGRTSTSS